MTGADLTTDAGQELFASLLSVAGPMSEYIDALERQEQVQSAIVAERYGLEVELLRELGREQDAVAMERARELDALDESNRAIQQRIWMLQDEAASVEQMRKKTDDVLQTLRDVVGNEIAKLDAEFDAFSGSLRAEYDAKAESLGRWLDTQLGTLRAPGRRAEREY